MVKIKVRKNTPEIPLIGDVDDWEQEAIKSLLEVAEGGDVVFYIDSAGGSVYGALALVTLIRLRRLKVTTVVLGECSSAALLIFGVAKRRFVSPLSTLLFHRMRWQSEKRVDSLEAKQWTAHFLRLENDLEELTLKLFGPDEPQVRKWTQDGQYLTGQQIVDAGLAELVPV